MYSFSLDNALLLIAGTSFIVFLTFLFVAFLFFSNRQLKEQRDRSQRYLDLASVIFVAINEKGNVTMINPKGCEILGYQNKDEVLGKNWFDNFLPEDSRKEVHSVFTQLMSGDIKPIEYFENEVLTKSGERRTIAWHNALLRDSKNNIIGTLSSGEDITEKRRLEAQLFQSQKMEAVGRLAGGVAHDFNNLLTVISGYTNFILQEIDENSQLHEDAKEILTASHRAAELTRQLLAFSRRQVFDVRVIDLNFVIRNLEKMLRRIIGEDIELVTVFEKDIGKVKADSGQIEQVILNLVVNARDAMLNGGVLTIETANVNLDQEYALQHYPMKPGDYVMISVSDTGIGMSTEIQKKIFEPFFTTKQMGKGTGLGLSTVYGIVKQSDGYIWVYSEPGMGTTFKVYLPRVEEEILPDHVKPPEYTSRGCETICLVEDELSVRKMTSRILKENGYSVLSAENGEQAIRIASDIQKPINLLITDVIMPGMNGKELAEKIKRIQPDAKVLFISGYTDNTIAHHGILHKNAFFLQKPFSQSILLKKVREILDS